MQVRVRAIGYLQRRMPDQKEEVMATVSDGTTVADLITQLGPDPTKILFIQVNGEKSTPDRMLAEGDLVDLYPRISGG